VWERSIKQTGWEEMLFPEERQRLAAWYVAEGEFGLKLEQWVGTGGGSRALATVEMRAKVGEELAGLEAVERDIAEGALQLAASRNVEYRSMTAAWWGDNVKTDRHFEAMLYECLDYTAAVVGAGVETRLAWGYVLTCVREDTSEVWRLTPGDLEVIKAYIAKHRPENGSHELRAVAWAMEVKVQNLERSLRALRWEFQGHLTTYNLDKVNSEQKFEEIDAKIVSMEALAGRVGEVEKLAGRVGEVEALAGRVGEVEKLAARVGELERLKSTPASTKKWWHMRVDGAAGAEPEKRIGALLGELERLGS
jgi:hypothetical protein